MNERRTLVWQLFLESESYNLQAVRTTRVWGSKQRFLSNVRGISNVLCPFVKVVAGNDF
jgi:hypothetical protein